MQEQDTTITAATIALRLAETRVRASALAAHVGVTKQWLSDALRGNRALRPARARQLLAGIEALTNTKGGD